MGKRNIQNIFIKALAVTPLRVSVTLVVAAAAITFSQDVSTSGIPILSTFENKALDLKFMIRGPQKPQEKVFIAAVDDRTLNSFGQWPLDRATVMAPLIQKICSYPIKALALDFFWSEPEHIINKKLRSQVEGMLRTPASIDEFNEMVKQTSGDSALAKAFESCGPKLIAAFSLTYAPPEFEKQADKLNREEYLQRAITLKETQKVSEWIAIGGAKIPKSFAEFEDPQFEVNTDFTSFRFGALTNNSTIFGVKVPQAYIENDAISDDGLYRHYTPVMAFEDAVLSSLALRTAAIAMGSRDRVSQTFREAKTKVEIPSQTSGRHFSLALSTPSTKLQLPVDTRGRLITNYRGPNEMFPHLSAVDILSPEDKIAYKRSPALTKVLAAKNEVTKAEASDEAPLEFLKEEIFKDAVVFLGSTAIGAHDVRPRPLSHNAYGVENHATVFDNIMSNDFIEHPSPELLMQLILGFALFGILYGFTLSKLSAKPGAFFALATITGVLCFDQFYLFNIKRILFPGYLQAMTLLGQYITIAVLKYAREESEKKFIRHAFAKFVSPDVVSQLVSDPSKLKIGGEKRELTVLFSDIAGFTELSERVEVKYLTQFLNEYLGAMTDVVKANGGTLDKYIGDAVMAFWGAPLATDDHAKLAVKTAIEMQKRVAELNRGFSERYGFEIEVRIGLNTGEVSVGNFGSNEVFSYTVIGDHVNLASRLEAVNKLYGTQILISEFTYHKLPADLFLSRELDLIKVKGKKKPVKIFEVLPKSTEGLKKDLLDPFQKALRHYYSRNWQAALSAFNEILIRNKNDKAAAEFVTRCRYYQTSPPDENWDGSWQMKTK